MIVFKSCRNICWILPQLVVDLSRCGDFPKTYLFPSSLQLGRNMFSYVTANLAAWCRFTMPCLEFNLHLNLHVHELVCYSVGLSKFTYKKYQGSFTYNARIGVLVIKLYTCVKHAVYLRLAEKRAIYQKVLERARSNTGCPIMLLCQISCYNSHQLIGIRIWGNQYHT